MTTEMKIEKSVLRRETYHKFGKNYKLLLFLIDHLNKPYDNGIQQGLHKYFTECNKTHKMKLTKEDRLYTCKLCGR